MNTALEFKRKFSRRLAIWHWFNLLVIALILLTVLIVKTIFNSRANVPVVQQALEKKGVIIDVEQARVVTKIYSKQLWDWHVYFGYALTALILYRILLEFFQNNDSKLLRRFKLAKAFLKDASIDKQEAKHYFMVKILYFIFYFDLFFMAATGLFIKFSSNYPQLKPIKEFIKEAHNVGMYFILSFIVLHLGGLLFFEWKQIKQSEVNTK